MPLALYASSWNLRAFAGCTHGVLLWCQFVLAAVALAQAPQSQPTSLQTPPAAEAGERPRLVLVCAVDQLARWTYAAARPHFAADGGFRRLERSGVAFAECAYAHACTETGPGHATLGTGASARGHGIVKNEWFDRDLGGKVYCAGDQRAAALPAFPEGKNRSAARLLVPTVGDLLRTQDARSKVIAVACKDRSAILMGGNRADRVVWFEYGTGNFVTNATWGEAPAWLAALHAARPADRWFDWTWDRIAPDSAYADCIDDRPFEMVHTSSGKRTLPVTIRGGRLEEPGAAFWLEAYLSPITNDLVLEVTLEALQNEQLGQDDVPDLLCVSFAATDVVGHYFGPDSVEARDTLLRFDRLLGTMLAALDREVGAGKWAIALSSDHGVALPPEVAKSKGFGGGRGLLHTRARAVAEADLRAHFRVAEGAGRQPFVLHAGENSLYLDRARIAAAAGTGDVAVAFAQACEVAAAAVAKVDGIDRGYVTAAVQRSGPGEDPLQRAVYHALCPGREGDVVFVVDPYWIEVGLAASHGSAHAYDREVPLLAMGPGLAAGVVATTAVTPGLCAVLAAHWLGLDKPAAAVDVIPADACVR